MQNGREAHGKRLAGHPFQLVRGNKQHGGGVPHGFDQHKPAEIFRHLFTEAAHVFGFPVKCVDRSESRGGILLQNGLRQRGQIIPGCHTRGFIDDFQGDMAVPAQALVQQGEGVP